MAPHKTTDPELKSFVSTQLLFSRMGDAEATDALEFLGADSADAPVPVDAPAELVGA